MYGSIFQKVAFFGDVVSYCISSISLFRPSKNLYETMVFVFARLVFTERII